MVNAIYRATLQFLHIKHTITYSIQHEAQAEPLVLIILAIAGGLVWSSFDGGNTVLRDSSFLVIGLLLGHFFWTTPTRR